MPTEMELTLEQTQQGVSYEVSMLSDIEDSHGPSDAMHEPLPATQSRKDFISKLTEIHSFLLTFSLRVFTMKMEILLEPTSNKLMVEHAEYDESNTYVLERFNTTAGNPVKKILLKLNLSDHRKLKEGGEESFGFAHGLYYKVPNVELETGLVRVINAQELYYMFDVANTYGWLEMYVDHHDMKLSQYLEAADTTIMDGVVAKWRGPPKTRYCNKFLVDELVNWAKNEELG
ncbi:hypothetical protein Tco_0756903 [Tanacetum coccineum]